MIVLLGVGLLDHMVILVSGFCGVSILFFTGAAPTHVPVNSVPHPLQHLLSVYFLMMAILTGVQ